MEKKQGTGPTFQKAITGKLTLNDPTGLGVTSILAIFTVEQGRKHFLTTAEPIKLTECAPGEEATYYLTEKSIENGQPLPGKRDGPYQMVPDGNCWWLVICENKGQDWIEQTRICVFQEGVEPVCPIGDVVSQTE